MMKISPKNIHIQSDISLDIDFKLPQFNFIIPVVQKEDSPITVYSGNKKDKSKSLF